MQQNELSWEKRRDGRSCSSYWTSEALTIHREDTYVPLVTIQNTLSGELIRDLVGCKGDVERVQWYCCHTVVTHTHTHTHTHTVTHTMTPSPCAGLLYDHHHHVGFPVG
jgi:hypothetical protein